MEVLGCRVSALLVVSHPLQIHRPESLIVHPEEYASIGGVDGQPVRLEVSQLWKDDLLTHGVHQAVPYLRCKSFKVPWCVPYPEPECFGVGVHLAAQCRARPCSRRNYRGTIGANDSESKTVGAMSRSVKARLSLSARTKPRVSPAPLPLLDSEYSRARGPGPLEALPCGTALPVQTAWRRRTGTGRAGGDTPARETVVHSPLPGRPGDHWRTSPPHGC